MQCPRVNWTKTLDIRGAAWLVRSTLTSCEHDRHGLETTNPELISFSRDSERVWEKHVSAGATIN
jgi:hypothetical protein